MNKKQNKSKYLSLIDCQKHPKDKEQNRADILFDTMDNEKKVSVLKTAAMNGMILSEHAVKTIVSDKLKTSKTELDKERIAKQKELRKQKYQQQYYQQNNSSLTKLDDKKKFLSEEEKEHKKQKHRADIIYGSDDEYNKKYYPNKLYANDKELEKIIAEIIENYQKYELEELDNLKFTEVAISHYIKAFQTMNSDNVPLDGLKFLIKTPLVNIFKNKLSNTYGYEAIENLIMAKSSSYLNTKYAKQHKIYNSYKETPIELQTHIKNKIIEQIGSDKLSTTGGIYIDSTTDTAKRLSQNADLKNFIKNNLGKLFKGKVINDSISFKSSNFYYAIGNADIYYMFKTKNNTISLFVIDVYDFNKDDNRKLVVAGRELQKEGVLRPYFVIYHLEIPINEIMRGNLYA